MKCKSKNHFSILYTIIFILLLVYAISLLTPLFWAFLSSLRLDLDFLLNPIGFPKEFKFTNYSLAWDVFFIRAGTPPREVFIEEMFLNSVLYAGGSALVQATVMFVVAYASSRFKFMIGRILYIVVILGITIPIVGSDPSAIAVAEFFGLRNSILGMYIMKGYFIGTYYLVFYEILRSFPKDYDEAAYMDGASNLTIMLKIIFPLASSTYFTVVLLLFVGFWNDYTTPLLFMPEVPTAAYGILSFWTNPQNGDAASVPVQLASSFIVLLPTLFVFITFHKRLLTNISIGGIKE